MAPRRAVSLAVADFLVGIAVLPYSLTLEVCLKGYNISQLSQFTFQILDTWLFGEIWCQGWYALIGVIENDAI